VLRGLHSRRPAVFNVYTPCPIEHGLPDNWARQAARLALESRAFPFFTYDPDAGPSFADCLSLEGNPDVDEPSPTYALKHVADDGSEASMDLPLTIADWAATEGRFKQHFREVPLAEWTDEMVPFHEYLALDPEGREGKHPFVHAVDGDRKLRRLSVSPEMVSLAEERRQFWSQLRQLAGAEVADSVRDRVTSTLEGEFEQRVSAIHAEYEAKLEALKQSYPTVIARKLAEGLMHAGEGRKVSDIIAAAMAAPIEPLAAPRMPDVSGVSGVPKVPEVSGVTGVLSAKAPASTNPALSVEGAPSTQSTPGTSAALEIEPYIDSEQCTSCNECTNISSKLFAYNEQKQATIKNARGGTFAQLVKAAEMCPVKIIHPGTPLNPKEKDLEKWVARAAAFN
jgi:pyruvate-ferredoxin/flavodoxin oxidoreductase